MARSPSFTPSTLDSLKSGKLHDPETAGLYLEVAKRGTRVWRYRRRISGTSAAHKARLGPFPRHSIADARAWARALNEKVETGLNPKVLTEEQERALMTVDRAHALYMDAVREGRASKSKRRNKPRTIADKLEMYDRDIAPRLGSVSIHDVTERDLVSLVIQKGRTARVRANRLAAELHVFFGWAASLRGCEVGLEIDPSRRLADLRFPEAPRRRKLDLDEIELLLKVLPEEEQDIRRGMLLWLLTATRRDELLCARSSELVDNDWTIPAERSKNGHAHTIRLGPWGRSLMLSNSEWVFPAQKIDGPSRSGWYSARDRILKRMSELAGRPIEHFTPHDFRRTARSNTKRLKVDFETAEAMMNHRKAGLERIYDGYELEEEKAAWFRKWEQEIVRVARKAGVAEALGVPVGR